MENSGEFPLNSQQQQASHLNHGYEYLPQPRTTDLSPFNYYGLYNSDSSFVSSPQTSTPYKDFPQPSSQTLREPFAYSSLGLNQNDGQNSPTSHNSYSYFNTASGHASEYDQSCNSTDGGSSQHQPDYNFQLLATELRDFNGSLGETRLENLLRKLRHYAAESDVQQEQLLRCDILGGLSSCMKSSSRELVREVVRTMRVLTNRLTTYPLRIEDSLFHALSIRMSESPECVDDILAVLNELTAFQQGKNSAYNARVHRTLGWMLRKLQHDPLITRALDVLLKITSEPAYCGALRDAEIFQSFRASVIHQLLNHFELQPIEKLDEEAGTIMWKMAMTEDTREREKLLVSMTRNCPEYCHRALGRQLDVMTRWSELMQKCICNDLELKQVKHDFVKNSYIVIRYGTEACLGPLVESLLRVCLTSDKAGKLDMINADTVQALLERYPVQRIWETLKKKPNGAFLAYGSRDDPAIMNVLTLITALLDSLPIVREPEWHRNNVVQTLYDNKLSKLSTVATGNDKVDELLRALLGAFDVRTRGWCAGLVHHPMITETSRSVRARY